MTRYATALLLLAAPLLSVGSAATPSADDGPRILRFRVVNAGPHRIRAVHVSPSKRPGWGENLLGRGLDAKQAKALQAAGLTGGGRTEVSVTGPCGLYDVRIVGEKGLEFVEEEIELCEDGDVLTLGKSDLVRVKQKDLGRQPE